MRIHYDHKLIIMVGNIGSGKTSTVNFFVNDGYLVVSLDAYRYMLGNGKYVFNPKTENALFQGQRRLIKELMKTGVNIVVDETNMSKHIRGYYIRLAQNFKYRATAVVMPRFTKETCVKHRMKDPHGQDDRKLWERIWCRFDSIYEYPTRAEGFVKVVKYERLKQE